MTTEKAIVSKDVFEALESLKVGENWNVDSIIQNAVGKRFISSTRSPLNHVPAETIAKALYVGYELEKPKVSVPSEEELAKRADQLITKYKRTGNADMFTYTDGVHDGIATALRILGIEVDGIDVKGFDL